MSWRYLDEGERTGHQLVVVLEHVVHWTHLHRCHICVLCVKTAHYVTYNVMQKLVKMGGAWNVPKAVRGDTYNSFLIPISKLSLIPIPDRSQLFNLKYWQPCESIGNDAYLVKRMDDLRGREYFEVHFLICKLTRSSTWI